MGNDSRDYTGESDARTLHEAHAIRKDKKKHANALKHLKKMSKYSSHAAHTHAHESKQHELLHGAKGESKESIGGSVSNAEGTPAEEQNESAHEEAAEGKD